MAQAKYISTSELAEAYDSRKINELDSDTGVIGDGTGAAVLNAIERASADVERHALLGNRYTVTSLATLQTNDDWTLKSVVATLAMVYLYRRRNSTLPGSVAEDFDRANELLMALRNGQMVFKEDANIRAGGPSISTMGAAKRGRLGLVSDSVYFPPRRTSTV